jgi:hypothetical protein
VRELERDHAGWLHQRGQARSKADQVRHVRVDVVAGDQIGLAVLCRNCRTGIRAEEQDLGTDALSARHLGHVGGRFDTEDRNAVGDEMLEQVTVVTSHLNHE